jgi:glycerol-3-phosphate dehydrogenase
VRPLLHAAGEVGAASREHGVVRDGALFTLAGGKYTTFRRMARDVVRAVADHLGRHGPIEDPAEPLPAPASEAVGIERMAELAAEHEFARRLEDVLRRRTLLWLTPDHGRVAAPRVAAVLAERLGWNPERTRDEIQRWEDGLREQEDLLRRASEGA